MATGPKTRAADWKAENRFVAEKLSQVADLLAEQDANRFRINAHREASHYAAQADFSLREVLERRGVQGLVDLPTIGVSIAALIAELLETGNLNMINRLRGEIDPEKVLQTVPMIGPRLARAIHEELGIETLEALEIAAHDGQLETLDSIGPRRLRGIRHSLAEMLARRRPRRPRGKIPAPPLETILDVDSEYRRREAAGELPKIAPRRFNPDGAAWLSILHTQRGEWRMTALYSNTANAHRLGRTRDWVVIYFEKDGTAEGQCTVVTETRGPLTGRRVVRGLEPRRAETRNQTMEATS